MKNGDLVRSIFLNPVYLKQRIVIFLRLKPLNDIQCDEAAFSRETLAQKRCTKKRHPLVRTLVA